MLNTVQLRRQSNAVSWGLGVQGGKDFGCPLSVVRVTANGLAETNGIRVNDVIVKINDLDTSTLPHHIAISHLKQNQVNLVIKPSETDGTSPITMDSIMKSSNHQPGSLPNSKSDTSQALSSTEQKQSHVQPVLHSSIKQTSDQAARNDWTNNPTDEGKFQMKMDGSSTDPTPVAPPRRSVCLDNSERLSKTKQTVSNSSHTGTPDKELTICDVCKDKIQGPYVLANRKYYCPIHFVCVHCNRKLDDIEYIENKDGRLYCVKDFKNFVAEKCAKCSLPVVQHQVLAMSKVYHPGCFICNHCHKPIPHGAFRLKENSETGESQLFCEQDYLQYYQISCKRCNFPIETDELFTRVGNETYHSDCYRQ